MKVRFTWKKDGDSFTIEQKDGKMTCLETGLSINKDKEYFDFFKDTMAEFADVEILEQ